MSRTCPLLLAACLTTGRAAWPAEPETPAAVRRVEMDAPKVTPTAPWDKPATFATERDWRAAFPGDEAQVARLKAGVDFSREHLYSFAWAGRCGDHLSAAEGRGPGGVTVTFTYRAGLPGGPVCHLFRLFTVPRGAAVRFVEQRRETDVWELDLTGFEPPRERPAGGFGEPVVIRSPDELAAAVGGDGLRARLRAEVDFGLQRVLLFAWRGRVGDQLTFEAADAGPGLQAVFRYHPGAGQNRDQYRLLAVPKAAGWKVADR